MGVFNAMPLSIRVLALVFAFSAITAGAQESGDVDTQCNSDADQLSQCLNRALENEGKRLEALYNLVVRMFDAGTINPAISTFYDEPKEMVSAQQAWLEYRDKQCAFDATMIGPLSASGVVAATGDCMSRMTRERIKYLQKVSEMIGHYSKLCKVNADACRPR
jgi:uncharacterized protein YecT (DUF1311 family)